MSIEEKSLELKTIVAQFETAWFIGNLSFLTTCIANGRANDQLGRLSSPFRQLTFLAGLHLSSSTDLTVKTRYSKAEWNRIIELLNEIEQEYYLIFYSENEETEEWRRIRSVSMPSFLSYFNQGHLNYEEQELSWTEELYSPFDELIIRKLNLSTKEFLQFYENLDQLCSVNFQAFSTRSELLKSNWRDYSKITLHSSMPEEIGFTPSEDMLASAQFMNDPGIINRFFVPELAINGLSVEKVILILNTLSCSRHETDFIYYTSLKPSNPIAEWPIIQLTDNFFQVFDVKEVMHSIRDNLQEVCCYDLQSTSAFSKHKGNLLESKIVEIFRQFFPTAIIYHEYFVDGSEQDILVLWKKYAFIIEAKGYTVNEPFRDPKKAFTRIKRDFKDSIGYGYIQTRRVERRFKEGISLELTDKDGKVIDVIDTSKFDDFSIIVNMQSFGQIQNDLYALLEREDEDDVFPWVVKFDDLEVFLNTLIRKRSSPKKLVDFLLMREEMHGKLICSDELEVCGGYLNNQLSLKYVLENDIIKTHPNYANVFDEQYNKIMGFKNEKNLEDKRSGKTIFW